MTEQRAKDLYSTFIKFADMGRCNSCGFRRRVIHHVMDMSAECFNCMLERVIKEESEREAAAEHRAKCEMFLKDFAKI